MVALLASAISRWRRRHPGPQRRLPHPVISIGNIAVGGRAKTPMAALVAERLLAAGERPAILSRGYGRARRMEAPVIVRDVDAVRAGLDESGDEPLMLAERLDGAILVVHPDRGRAGAVATTLGATVFVLDDGFQHLRVARDLDIVMIDPGDLDECVLPVGRLREPVDALAHADGVVVVRSEGAGGSVEDVRARLARFEGVQLFDATRRTEAPGSDMAGQQAFVVTGLADGRQFTNGARAAGWTIAGERHFGDHHRYSARDVAAIEAEAAKAGAMGVLTSAKDAVRLREHWRSPLPLHIADLSLEIEPREAFDEWLMPRVRDSRRALADAARRVREEGARRVG